MGGMSNVPAGMSSYLPTNQTSNYQTNMPSTYNQSVPQPLPQPIPQTLPQNMQQPVPQANNYLFMDNMTQVQNPAVVQGGPMINSQLLGIVSLVLISKDVVWIDLVMAFLCCLFSK